MFDTFGKKEWIVVALKPKILIQRKLMFIKSRPALMESMVD